MSDCVISYCRGVFDKDALNLIFDYLTRKKQKVKINFSFSLNSIWIYFKELPKDQFYDHIIKSISL